MPRKRNATFLLQVENQHSWSDPRNSSKMKNAHSFKTWMSIASENLQQPDYHHTRNTVITRLLWTHVCAQWMTFNVDGVCNGDLPSGEGLETNTIPMHQQTYVINNFSHKLQTIIKIYFVSFLSDWTINFKENYQLQWLNSMYTDRWGVTPTSWCNSFLESRRNRNGHVVKRNRVA